MIIFPKKPLIAYNNIELQNKTSNNSLTIYEWNHIVNVLSMQTNTHTKYLLDLHKLLFGEHTNEGEILFHFDSGLLNYMYGIANKMAEDTHIIVSNDVTAILTLLPDKFFSLINPVEHLTIMFAPPVEGRTNEYTGQFSVGDIVPEVIFPEGIVWIGGDEPVYDPNTTYQFSILNNIGVMVGV